MILSKRRSLLNEATSAAVFFIAARSIEDLTATLENFSADFNEDTRHQQIAYSWWDRLNFTEPLRAAFVAGTYRQAQEKIGLLRSALKNNSQNQVFAQPLLKAKGIYIREQTQHSKESQRKIGFLFPGQGSQYVDMLKDLYEKYAVVQDTFLEADRILEPFLNGKLTEHMFSKNDETQQERAERELRIKQTQITQPGVLAADVALWRLLASFGINPDLVCGHSLGEYAALVAGGVLSFPDALTAVSIRAKEMVSVQCDDPGKMASVAADIASIEPLLMKISGYVAIANKNGPRQTAIAGESKAVEEAVNLFGENGYRTQFLPVSHAFHCAIVAPAGKPYAQYLSRLNFQRPAIPILSNVTGDYYPNGQDAIRKLLVEQISHPVEFIRQIERMHEDGVRIFVEVGPKRVLSSLVAEIMDNKQDVLMFASNNPKRGGIHEFQELLAKLFVEGVNIQRPDNKYFSS